MIASRDKKILRSWQDLNSLNHDIPCLDTAQVAMQVLYLVLGGLGFQSCQGLKMFYLSYAYIFLINDHVENISLHTTINTFAEPLESVFFPLW